MNQNFMDCDAILIDDDPIVHALWKRAARAIHLELQTIVPSADWLEKKFDGFSALNRQIPIYIDSHLGLALRGEELAKQLFEMGFQNLFLTTGYIGLLSETQFPWIKAILDKNPPAEWSVLEK